MHAHAHTRVHTHCTSYVALKNCPSDNTTIFPNTNFKKLELHYKAHLVFLTEVIGIFIFSILCQGTKSKDMLF